ncbi:hypothetical protein EPI10_016432 [Gossypium australe]|uniref:Uncharacterized protein n=1 Tax=Gossypium australe TaxID=47621 RepID=A0A5B6VNX7_9ROSI|nr:hypothetical protein EPI10_016432 [Gossypium australe]
MDNEPPASDENHKKIIRKESQWLSGRCVSTPYLPQTQYEEALSSRKSMLIIFEIKMTMI